MNLAKAHSTSSGIRRSRLAAALGLAVGLVAAAVGGETKKSHEAAPPAKGAAWPGLERVELKRPVAEAADRLEAVLEEKGMTVFARVDHAAGARKVGVELRPAVLVIFGNPKVGSKLMKDALETGVDLPMKMLFWEDAEGRRWASYNAPAYLARRHGLGPESASVLEKVNRALAKLARAAAGLEEGKAY